MVEEQVRRIRRFGNHIDVLIGKEANQQTVLSGLRDHSWAQSTCRGRRDSQPFQSAFEFDADESLTLLDLVRTRLPSGELAFLSACHAAAPDMGGTPDESIHLAGALQFCGFRSVVGTLWAMADIDGPDVAEDFHQYMFVRVRMEQTSRMRQWH
jgi:CHAT domain-containing protein